MLKFSFRKKERSSSSPPASPSAARQQQQEPQPQQHRRGETLVFRVIVPPGVQPGQDFQTMAGNRMVLVRCPPNAVEGQALSITIPKEFCEQEEESLLNPPQQEFSPPSPPYPRRRFNRQNSDTQLFEVTVPPGIQPGTPFSLVASGQRILVTCPLNASAGDKIRFNVPKELLNRPNIVENETQQIRLDYKKSGWARNVRLNDLKFQWIRMDDKGEVELHHAQFDMTKSAYVRKLYLQHKDDSSMRQGMLELVPAADAVADSCIKGSDGRVLVSYTDIAAAQVLSFEEKVKWFHEACAKFLKVPYGSGHMQINVRRDSLVVDSLNAIVTMSRKELRKYWRFAFLGEVDIGIDAGGLTREWFQLVTQELMNADFGLWQSSTVNQMCMQINPASVFLCDGHLVYYRFFGRVIGRALMDQQLISGHLVQHIYKHILGWPVTFADLERVDEEYYKSLKQIVDYAESGQDLSFLCLDFTTAQELLGDKQEIELVENGKDIELTNENYLEYLEACLKYRMLDCVREQLNELLLGIFDVIPEPLLAVFDFQELELLMCGLPEIDIGDWRSNTEYSGEFDRYHGGHVVIEWFWEVVYEFDHETRARLLQFVTGTSGVPARGFCCLQGNDGDLRKFTIHGVSSNMLYYPRTHTCFNRIDLPLYESKDVLRERLKLAVAMGATGFDIE